MGISINNVVEQFLSIDTTCVSDAIDRIGIKCGLLGIKPIVQGKKICGPAYTVRYLPCGEVKGSVGDFLDDVPSGYVVVIDNNGRTDCTVWGDLMSLAASMKKINGTVINGVCRDIPAIRELEYPVYSKGYYMVTGKDRVELESINKMISISGVQVNPGDLIFADDSGVIVIPIERAGEILSIAKEINEKEKMIEQEIRKGISLKEARNKVNYHHLQSKQERV